MGLISMRFRICLLLLAGLSASVSMRTHFSMTLVCMLKKAMTNSTLSSMINESIEDGCPAREVEVYEGISGNETGNIDWSREMTPYLFTIVMIGQVAALATSAYISSKIATSKILLFAILTQVAITIISPFLASISYWAFFVSRLAMGMAEGLFFPQISALASRWFPPNERASMAALYTSALQIANGVSPYIVSFLCTSSLGWQAAFYLFGLLGILWAAEWMRVGSDFPSSNKLISHEEKDLLAKCQTSGQKRVTIRPPYGKMFTSPVLFAHISAVIAFYFTLSFMSAFLPTFFEERLRLPIRKNGLFTMLPFLAQIGAKNGLARILDYFKRRGSLGHTAAAKIGQTMGCLGASSSLLILLFFADCNHPGVALTATIFCCALHSCMAVGFFVSMQYICPPLTGTIASIVTACGVTASGVSTAIMGVTSNYEHKYELIFGLCITCNLFACVVYLVWGTAEEQPWAEHSAVSGEEKKEDKLMEEGGEMNEITTCPSAVKEQLAQ